MANRYLCPVYKALYGKDFDYSVFDQRMEMQKAVYLLQNMGVPVGEYGFRWYLHGPYSQSLLDDMHFEAGRPYPEITLLKEYNDSIERLRKVIESKEKRQYTISMWVECLASLHYLRENVMHFKASKDDIVAELERRKSHLSDHEANIHGYILVEGLFE